MNGEWNHAICVVCWNAARPDRPTRVVGGSAKDMCCYCGEDTYYTDEDLTVREFLFIERRFPKSSGLTYDKDVVTYK